MNVNGNQRRTQIAKNYNSSNLNELGLALMKQKKKTQIKKIAHTNNFFLSGENNQFSIS